ncbi:MAG: glycosyltransferase family 4 protein [Candidatus Bilamarchaeaceae archaeon]
MTMKILLCPEYFFPHVGGGEVWLFHLSKILVNKGYGITVISYKHPKCMRNEILSGIKILRIGLFPIAGVQPYFKRAIVSAFGVIVYGFKLEYDILLVNQTFPLLPSYLVSKIKRKPIIAVFHDIYGLKFSLKEKGLIKGLIRGIVELISIKLDYDIILTVSESTKRKLVNVGVKENKIHVVGGGVDLNEIDFVNEQKSPKPTIIFVGRLVRLKKVENLLLAFKKVITKVHDAELYIVGSGPQENMLKKLAEELDLTSKVFFTGYVSEEEKIRLMKKAWVLVQPSVAEGFGLVLVEANACKTPVIAVDSGGPREVIMEGRTGFLVEANNIGQIAEKIIEILEDKNRILKMGEDGRRVVEENYTWEKVAERVEKIILGYLKQKNKLNI